MQRDTDNTACFNLNFSNPGGTTPLQSLILSPSSKTNCSSDEMAAVDSDVGSKESTPQLMFETGNPSSSSANRLPLPNGKKTKGRVKIKMEYIGNKLRRYTTFSKRKTGIMKKAHELSTLTGTQVMLIVASETGHVYAFATNKLKPLISGEPGKSLIQNCLNAPDDTANDLNAVKTEFTFEPPSGCANLPSSRKRKLDANDEMMSLPTMVPSINEYCDSDNDSADSHMDDDEQPPILRQSNMDPVKLLQEAMRVASEQQKRQIKPQKPKSQQIKVANNRHNKQQTSSSGNQLEQALLAIFAQGLSASYSSGAGSSPTHKNPTSCCRASSTPSPTVHYTSKSNQAGTSKPVKRPTKAHKQAEPETHTQTNASHNAEQPTILFQMPQGTVYVTSESPDESVAITPPPPLIASNSLLDETLLDSSQVFSAAMNGSSSSASSASPANNLDEHNQQQLINSLLFNNSGNNMQHFFEIFSRLNDSNGQIKR